MGAASGSSVLVTCGRGRGTQQKTRLLNETSRFDTVWCSNVLTGRVGFEPTIPLRVRRFSRPVPSTTQTPAQGVATFMTIPANCPLKMCFSSVQLASPFWSFCASAEKGYGWGNRVRTKLRIPLGDSGSAVSEKVAYSRSDKPARAPARRSYCAPARRARSSDTQLVVTTILILPKLIGSPRIRPSCAMSYALLGSTDTRVRSRGTT